MVAVVCESLIERREDELEEQAAQERDKAATKHVESSSVPVEDMFRHMSAQNDLLGSQEEMQKAILEVKGELLRTQSKMQNSLDDIRKELLDTQKEMKQTLYAILQQLSRR
jgi:septation ring formation regulator EzrA